MKKNYFQRFFASTILTLSIAYIAIETQSMLLLWDVINTAVPSADLSRYERFGYATTGIGITLLIFRSIKVDKVKTLPLLLSLMMLPVVYATSAWTAYEAVSRAPSFIPTNSRPDALYASMAMLTSPSLQSATGFWFSKDRTLTPSVLVDNFTSKYPVPQKVIQKTYLEGVKTIPLITGLFDMKHKYLTEDTYKKLHKKTSYVAFSKINHKQNYENALLELIKYNMTSFGVNVMSPSQISALATKHNLTASSVNNLTAASLDMSLMGKFPRFSGIQKQLTYADRHYRQSINDDINAGIQANKWQSMKEALPFLHGEAPKIELFEYTVRKQFTDDAFGKFIGESKLTPLEWYRGQKPSDTQTYKEMTKHLTPFFFDKNGNQLFDFEKLNNNKEQINIRSALMRGLNDELFVFYSNYRKQALDMMVKSPSNWGNFVNNATFEPLLRFSVIIPILFLVSLFLLSMNLINTFRDNKVAAITGLSLAVFVVFFHGGQTTEFMIDTLLPISVKEAVIVLF